MSDPLTIDKLAEAIRALGPGPAPLRYVLVSIFNRDHDHILIVDNEMMRRWTYGTADVVFASRPLFDAMASPRAMLKMARALRRQGQPRPRRLWKRLGCALYELP